MNIPSKNGLPVTFRQFVWKDMVLRQWGERWGEHEVVYEFSNGSQKLSTDYYITGFYR